MSRPITGADHRLCHRLITGWPITGWPDYGPEVIARKSRGEQRMGENLHIFLDR
ncbi:MAG: hypothetical protein NTZ24_12130 [Deltaproteobacteria bacterium]|nr:hypothetical protein [Deltaproteobacteria bacterium]